VIDSVLWLSVVVLALFAAKLTIPKPPNLDWERFFSVALATLVRGSLEKNKGEFSDWVTRMSALLGVDETSELFDDPAQLGDEYDVEHALGRPCGWEKVAAWSDEVSASMVVNADEMSWIYVGDPNILLDVDFTVPSLQIIQKGGEVASDLQACIRSASDRLVVFAGGNTVEVVARALHSSPALRDRVKAVVSLNGDFGEWFTENFTHEAMDTELSRSTPWFSIGINKAGDEVWKAANWPEQVVPESGRRAIESISLGSVTVEPRTNDVDLVIKALMLTLFHRFSL
jgi:hypothetical protein